MEQHSLKYEDIAVSITLNSDDIHNMGISHMINDCRSKEEAYALLYNQLASIISDFGRLNDMHLLNDIGELDFVKLKSLLKEA